MGSDKPGTMGLEWWQFWLVRVKSSNSRSVQSGRLRKAWDAAPRDYRDPSLSWLLPSLALPGDSLLLGLAGPHGPRVPPGPSHLGPKRFHSPQQVAYCPQKPPWLCLKHQGLLKPWREVIPECHETVSSCYRYEGGLTRRVAGRKGKGWAEGRREKNLDKAVIQTEPPSKRVVLLISLSFPASLPKGIPPQLSLTLL